MNNYNFLQRLLHRLALAPKFMREATFDAEDFFINATSNKEEHVFIAGLARSGTTILLNAIFKSENFASLSYADMPFVLAPNLWSKISFSQLDKKATERAHGDGIIIRPDSPEAFEEIFWKTFDEKKSLTHDKYKIYINNILKKYDRESYLSKNNQNFKRLDLIAKLFPESKILIPVRNPIQQAGSLLFQHKRFIENSKQDNFISNYMKWIGHTEFGPNYLVLNNKNINFVNDMDINHWLEQWYLSYKNCLDKFEAKSNMKFIIYEYLCESKSYWFEILDFINIENKYEYDFSISIKDYTFEIDKDLKEKCIGLYKEISDNNFVYN